MDAGCVAFIIRSSFIQFVFFSRSVRAVGVRLAHRIDLFECRYNIITCQIKIIKYTYISNESVRGRRKGDVPCKVNGCDGIEGVIQPHPKHLGLPRRVAGGRHQVTRDSVDGTFNQRQIVSWKGARLRMPCKVHGKILKDVVTYKACKKVRHRIERFGAFGAQQAYCHGCSDDRPDPIFKEKPYVIFFAHSDKRERLGERDGPKYGRLDFWFSRKQRGGRLTHKRKLARACDGATPKWRAQRKIKKTVTLHSAVHKERPVRIARDHEETFP